MYVQLNVLVISKPMDQVEKKKKDGTEQRKIKHLESSILMDMEGNS
jgi:hypothetical protein